ncbi:hypothetical protein L1987_37213 [Smallanthus sonchifolius]|uniref:Uncharacterized protein n=1 Tax=Smallanthus sonchifolius TaxID=185202 RepID=A0ACB9HH11_9ASTR|nr:hypothetical protein L1987_37213 [Smallanthus sonchifolius]
MARLKGHGMLAHFTAGWEASDLHPKGNRKGSYVYDTNGKKYLDSLAGLWCTSLGGSEPRLVAAATKQLNTLPFYHSFWNHTTKPSLDLAEELLEMFTANKMKKVFFTNSGSEANDTQVKLVCLPPLHQSFDLPSPFVLYTDCPHYWRYNLPGETEEQFSTRLAKNLENLIIKEGPETIAAFIAEPIHAVVKKYDILFVVDEVSQ